MKLDWRDKFSLKDWLAFSFEERTALCHFPSIPRTSSKLSSLTFNFCRGNTSARRWRHRPGESWLWDNTDRYRSRR
jgi:hypothetical protein